MQSLIRPLVCLLIGIVMTIAVAWYWALEFDLDEYAGVAYQRHPLLPDPEDVWSAYKPAAFPDQPDYVDRCVPRGGLRVVTIGHSTEHDSSPATDEEWLRPRLMSEWHQMYLIRAGWPAPALQSVVLNRTLRGWDEGGLRITSVPLDVPPSLDLLHVDVGAEVRAGLLVSDGDLVSWTDLGPPRALPLVPLWYGLTVNTTFFGGIAYLISSWWSRRAACKRGRGEQRAIAEDDREHMPAGAAA